MMQLNSFKRSKKANSSAKASLIPRYFSDMSRSTLIALFSTLALVNITACSNTTAANVLNEKANLVPPSAAEPPVKPKQSTTSLQEQKPQVSNTVNSYQKATDIAAGAITISKSAVSREDWSLVASRWQDAVKLLKTVPSSSRQYKTAQKKLTEYQDYLANAKLRAAPLPKKSCSRDTNPQFFSIPIKGRAGGTPIVEVAFNDRTFDMLFDTGATHTLVTRSIAATLSLPIIGTSRMTIANGSTVTLPIALVKSQGVDGRVRVKVPVAVAPPAMPIGLLGQDFSKGYDVAIKEDAIEFRRRGSTPSVSQNKGTCLVDTSPQSFSVPIVGRRNNIPIVKVAFNDQYQFPMMFDTGASGTLITRPMAIKMRLIPAGFTQGKIADGSVATFAIAYVKSQRIAGRIKRYMEVAVAPPQLDMGLLGQDFFEGYNYTIKENVIEFHRQASTES